MFGGFRVRGFTTARSFSVHVGLALFVICLAAPAQHEIRNTPKRVLILYSYDREEGIFEDFDRALRPELAARAHDHVQFFTEYLDMVRFNSPEHARNLGKLLQVKYSTLKPDLVIPVSFAALNFVLGEGRTAFAGIPIVTLFNTRNPQATRLASANRERLPGITGIATTDESTRTLELALKLQPDLQRLVVIIGASPAEQGWFHELQGDFALYKHRVQLSFVNGPSTDSLMQTVRALPPHTAILYTYFFEDATGRFFLPEEALDLITKASSVPVYGVDSTYIGHGILAGHLTDSDKLGIRVAGLAARILNGEKASGIPIVSDDYAQDTVDWRELRRWDISEKRVPAGAVTLFREPTLWQRDRTLILSAIGLLTLETLLVIALVLNVNRLRRAEKALLQEKTLVDAVIESFPGLFVLQDEELKNIRWNKNSERVYRYSPQDAPPLGNVADYDREAVDKARQEAFAKGQGNVEADLLNAQGGANPYYLSAVRVDLGGKRYLAALGLDLSPLKKAETALRQSEAELRSFMQNAPYGIARVSVREDRFLSANPSQVRMLGYKTEQEVLTLKLSRDLYFGGEFDGFRAQPTRADYFNGVEFVWKRRDGKPVTVRASGRRSFGADGEVLELIVEDVTGRRALEEQLRHAQKMEALGQLAGSTAHDFNNILAVIIGHCELLAATLGDGDVSKSRVGIIKKAGERAASLTSQLLAFSRRQVMQLKTLNINSLVMETNKMLGQLMGEDIEHRLELDQNLGMIRADSGQMVQVIMNLAVNARDAMPNGGVLGIATSRVTFAEDEFVDGVAVPRGAYVVLSVSDTGTGMDADTKTHIFEPFFTTKPVGKGTGLGLATVFGIVKQSGGFIFVESEPGSGTTFKIYFPQVESAAEVAAVPKAYVPGQSSRTVLVVEDEPALRNLLVEGLQAGGYRVLVAENGAHAMRTAEQNAGRIDLLLTDVIMPQMSGPDLAICLKSEHPEIKVLYMSGYTDDKLDVIATDNDVALMQKPFYMQDLLRKADEVLSHSPNTSFASTAKDRR